LYLGRYPYSAYKLREVAEGRASGISVEGKNKKYVDALAFVSVD
jgi:hypothetical protein